MKEILSCYTERRDIEEPKNNLCQVETVPKNESKAGGPDPEFVSETKKFRGLRSRTRPFFLHRPIIERIRVKFIFTNISIRDIYHPVCVAPVFEGQLIWWDHSIVCSNESSPDLANFRHFDRESHPIPSLHDLSIEGKIRF